MKTRACSLSWLIIPFAGVWSLAYLLFHALSDSPRASFALAGGGFLASLITIWTTNRSILYRLYLFLKTIRFREAGHHYEGLYKGIALRLQIIDTAFTFKQTFVYTFQMTFQNPSSQPMTRERFIEKMSLTLKSHYKSMVQPWDGSGASLRIDFRGPEMIVTFQQEISFWDIFPRWDISKSQACLNLVTYFIDLLLSPDIMSV